MIRDSGQARDANLEGYDRRADRLRAARAGELAWMDAEEAAEYLGESPSRFRAAASRGEFERYKDIGGYKYSRQDLDQYRRLRVCQ